MNNSKYNNASSGGITTGTVTVNSLPRWNYCANCGRKTQDGENFCPSCGTRLGMAPAFGTWYPPPWTYIYRQASDVQLTWTSEDPPV